jgi:hypothetical protein
MHIQIDLFNLRKCWHFIPKVKIYTKNISQLFFTKKKYIIDCKL